MPVDKPYIAIKIDQLTTTKKILESGGRAVMVIGGRSRDTGAAAYARMHGARIANLQWAASKAEGTIRNKIAALTKTVSADVLACKYGDIRGLSEDELLVVSMIEDLEWAIGAHPVAKERGV